MANMETLRARLGKRIPGRTNDELDGWLVESAVQHKFEAVADVPAKKENAILAFAEYVGLKAKAAETAENPALNIPGKIGVNKSGSSSNYEKLIKEAWKGYLREARAAGIRVVAGGVVTNNSVARADGR